MYKKLEHDKLQLDKLRSIGIQRGKSFGWPWDLLPWTIKEGKTTYIGATPASGKTELWFEILINLSCLYGWKHVIFSPETGESTDIFSELCHKYIGKPFIANIPNAMTESERTQAEYFVNEHFVVVDPIDEDLTLAGFYELIDKIESELAIKFNTTTIDPWNELTEEYVESDLGREDKYLSRLLGIARKNARKTNRHNCIITHVRDQAIVKKGEIMYYPPPTARDFAGGQVWFRKGLSLIIPWRPPHNLEVEPNVFAQENELHVRVAKSKPKGVSINGNYKMFLDTFRYQYYMMDELGRKVYADRGKYSLNEKPKEQVLFSSEPKPLKPNVNFYEPKEDDELFNLIDNVPF